MANVFTTDLIDEGSLRAGASGIAFGIRLPWYRSLPLSVIEVAEVKVDGRAVPPSKLRLELNGRTFGLDELADQAGEWWYVLDSARIHVDAPQGEASTSHDVELTLNLFPPYIPGLTWVTRGSRSFNGQ